MKYDEHQRVDVVHSDGFKTIGHVDGRAAIWDGYGFSPRQDDVYLFVADQSWFGDDFMVVESRWARIPK